jgi:hypothetical protein
MLHFLKELPTAYLVWVSMIILLAFWVITRERELLILVNLALGALLNIARGKTTPSQDIENQNIDKVIFPESLPGEGEKDANQKEL